MSNDQSVTSFLDQLASAAPTPGGGSAAAVLGAMGAALLSMVCNLTVGKKAYRDVEPQMQAALERAESLRAQMQGLVQADIDAFSGVMQAYAMPRGDEAEKLARREAIQDALEAATAAPLACARVSADIIALSREVAEKGNRNVITDAGVAVVAAEAALRSAALNVYINTGSIEDEAFASAQLEALDAILAEVGTSPDEIYAGVVRALT